MMLHLTNFRPKELWLFILLFATVGLQAQFVISERNKKELLSLHQSAVYFDAKQGSYALQEVRQLPASAFQPMKGVTTDFGFTKNNYWIRFVLVNDTNEDLLYFLETARPITDFVDLYAIRTSGEIQQSVSGDGIPFVERDFADRKTIFKINLKAKEKTHYYLHLRSDGEALTVPLLLHDTEDLLPLLSFEQMVFGFFYGILFVAALLYFFFFFAMREKVFLYYSLYIVFIGLLQFSVDGYFYQFFTPGSGWLSLHAVLLSATLANFFLGRYTQVYLKVDRYSTLLSTAFFVLYGLDLLSFIAILFVPSAVPYCYPLANFLGLVLLLLIIASLFVVYLKTKTKEWLFGIGIFFLVAGFIIFIFKNFSLLPLNFWTENSSKLGTGVEVIFLSLSMANLIRLLKNERGDLQQLALQRSEEMSELKSYFLSNISHELRTPLNTIVNVTDSIVQDTQDQKLVEHCRLIQNSSKSLLSSVNDILDFSKIEKNELQLERTTFDSPPLLAHISRTYEALAKEKGLVFMYSKSDKFPTTLVGDAVRLEQIASNMLSNAIKFTPEGNIQFYLDCEWVTATRINLMLTVSDTGVGISKEKLHSIFDSFSQENINNKRKYYGLGLGLYIVKNLVDLHHGSITVDSQMPIGTTFTIVLPYEVAVVEEKMEEPAVVPADFDLKGKRILVVEDNAMNQLVIKMITKKWLNTTIEYATNGEEGVRKLREDPFDLVLMDLQMPVMDGYEAAIAIRKGEAGESHKDIPIIAVTADVMEATKERVFAIGMNRFLSKPIDKAHLYESIVGLL